MRIFFLLLTLSLYYSCSSFSARPAHNITDWEKLNIKGRVKSIETLLYRNTGEFGDFSYASTDPGERTGKLEFNTKGYIYI